MIAALKPDGAMAVVVPHGVLFRGGREGTIRQGILEADILEAVIGLPPALFYGTGISAAVLVINKRKPPERVGKVLFINADRDFEREERLNTLRPEDIARITTAYDDYADVERFSRVVGLGDIEANSFNLHIPRYADSSPLKEAINNFDRELSLNPTGLTKFQKQLDSMLTVIGELSEADYLRSIIRQGESKTVEFKETFSLDVRKETKEKYIEESSLKTVVAFLNSDGGVLLIGVNDDEKIIGIDVELKKFHKNVLDKFLLHFKNTMRSRIGEEFYPFINYRLLEAEERRVLVVECEQSERPCFLDEKVFYVRTNPATDKLEGTKQYEYIKHRFGV